MNSAIVANLEENITTVNISAVIKTALSRRRLKMHRVNLPLCCTRGEKSRLVGTHRREYSHKLAEPGRIEPPENIPAG